MTLLEFERVSKRRAHGHRTPRQRRRRNDQLLLHEVSLSLDAGELVGIWGLRGSGRSTLLRIAAGIEAPDGGHVRLAERELPRTGQELAERIAYCDPVALRRRAYCLGGARTSALDELILTQLARGVEARAARMRALEALARTGAECYAQLAIGELDGAEAARVALAQALSTQPALLLIDEPTKSVDLLERDGILKLLRSLADEGIAILMSVSETTGLLGANRSLTLGRGELHGNVVPTLAEIVQLPRRLSA